MHMEKVFLIIFPSQIRSLWDIQCFLWDLLFGNKVLLFVNIGKGLINLHYAEEVWT